MTGILDESEDVSSHLVRPLLDSARDVQTIDDTQSNIRSKSSTTMDGGVAECDGSKSNPHSSFIEKYSEKGNSRTCIGNLETVQKLSSETELDIVPRKKPLKPESR